MKNYSSRFFESYIKQQYNDVISDKGAIIARFDGVF